jgi:hypothetical protein
MGHMQRHFSRVVKYGWLPAATLVAVLVSDMDTAIANADKNTATILRNSNIANPPENAATYVWTHPLALLVAIALLFLVGALISWGIEAVWARLQGNPAQNASVTPPPVQPSQSSAVVTLGMKVTRAPQFDVALTEAALYAVTGNWGMIAGKEHFSTDQERVAAGNKVADWLADFEQKASDGSVRVWGKPRDQSDSPLVEIDALHWRDHEAFTLSVATGEPTTRLRGVPSSTDGFEDLRVNRAEFEREWSRHNTPADGTTRLVMLAAEKIAEAATTTAENAKDERRRRARARMWRIAAGEE